MLTVEENLRIGLPVRGKRTKDSPKDIPDKIFELFPVLKDMLHRRGGDLSGGQQQQLAIGRALVLEPKVLILDEPNEGIQPNIVKQIGDVILKLNEEEGNRYLGRAKAWLRSPCRERISPDGKRDALWRRIKWKTLMIL